MYSIRISKGGKLIANIWDKKEKKCFDKDVSHNLLYHLNDECTIDEGVILKDILLLSNLHSSELSPIYTRSSNDITDLILSCNESNETSNLDHLVLSWWMTISNWVGDESCLTKRLDFCGRGKPRDDEMYDQLPRDQLISYSLSLSPVKNLVHLPIILNPQVQIYDERESMINAPILAKATMSFTLHDILYGVFGELTVFGSEADKEKQRKKLEQQIQDIKEGKVETISWEEMKKKLKERQAKNDA